MRTYWYCSGARNSNKLNSCSPIVHLEEPDTAGVSPFSGADVSHGHVPLYVQQPGMPTPHMVCPGHVSSRDALLAQPGVPVRVGHGLAASLTRPGRRGTCSAGHSHGMQHCGEHGCEPFSANRASPPSKVGGNGRLPCSPSGNSVWYPN